ncbi:next to BRCA1 gene 1 protein [Pelodytes ibericus]
METQVNLCVDHRGESHSFLVSDSKKTTWADVEAMVQVSFDLNNIQIKYIDEDNEEVSVNSQDEYEEALKIAVKQGGQLQMIVYEKQHPSGKTNPLQRTASMETAAPENLPSSRSGKRPLGHYSLMAKAVGQMLQNRKTSNKAEEPKRQHEDRETIQPDWFTNYIDTEKPISAEDRQSYVAPPNWFTNYMDTFKEQIVFETVAKVSQSFREKLPQSHDFTSDNSSPSTGVPEKDRPTSLGDPYDWLMTCNNCSQNILGIRYKCSTCTSYSICERCEAEGYMHNPNHLFLKMRKPVDPSSKLEHTLLPFSLENAGFQKQMHKAFLKAEKQRLRAEKKQRKAEVKELEKRMRLHRRIHQLSTMLFSAQSLQKPHNAPRNSLVIPMQPCNQVIPTLSAVFVDENLPDGTHLQPGTRFIKHWRMKNTGNVKWNQDTKLKFMWGNLTLASSSRKHSPVPSLIPGQVGIFSVEFIAPALEGTYTSHWRLEHKSEQFGPRIWCSIIVDSVPCTDNVDGTKERISSGKISSQEEYSKSLDQQLEQVDDEELTADCSSMKMSRINDEAEIYLPSVDILTAQDLLSFELLDINIVQELERVPHNTPADMTPCMSPLPHDGPLLEKSNLGQIEEEYEGFGNKMFFIKRSVGSVVPQEESEGDISGTQFVCETVIRSLTLDAAPDYNPPQKSTSQHSSLQSTSHTSFNYSLKSADDQTPKSSIISHCADLEATKDIEGAEEERTPNADSQSAVGICQEDECHRDEIESQGSCDSAEDYIIILPECFDTSRPLGESMYSSAISENEGDKDRHTSVNEETRAAANQLTHSINDILTTSQTLDAVPLTPELLRPLAQLRVPQETRDDTTEISFEPTDIRASVREQTNREQLNKSEPNLQPSDSPPSPKEGFDHRQHTRGSIAGGLVKGALSVAASAYKALFAGQQDTATPTCSEEQAGAMMAILLEMGFCDRQLNQRLLRKHNYNLMDVANELIQINDNDWYSARY